MTGLEEHRGEGAAGDLRRGAEVGEVEHRRVEVEEARERGAHARRHPGTAHQERHAQRLFVQVEGVVEDAVLAEGLAVVADDHDDERAAQGDGVEALEDWTKRGVGVGDLLVVAVHRGVAELSRRRAVGVRVVRLHQVRPQEERSLVLRVHLEEVQDARHRGARVGLEAVLLADVVEALEEARGVREIARVVEGPGGVPGVVELLGEGHVAGLQRRELHVGAPLHHRGVAAGPDAREGAQRARRGAVGVGEARGPFGEVVDVRRRRPTVAVAAHVVRAHGVDGEKHHARAAVRQPRRQRHEVRVGVEVLDARVAARAVLVDAVARDVTCARRDARVAVVAVAAVEHRGVPVAVPVEGDLQAAGDALREHRAVEHRRGHGLPRAEGERRDEDPCEGGDGEGQRERPRQRAAAVHDALTERHEGHGVGHDEGRTERDGAVLEVAKRVPVEREEPHGLRGDGDDGDGEHGPRRRPAAKAVKEPAQRPRQREEQHQRRRDERERREKDRERGERLRVEDVDDHVRDGVHRPEAERRA